MAGGRRLDRRGRCGGGRPRRRPGGPSLPVSGGRRVRSGPAHRAVDGEGAAVELLRLKSVGWGLGLIGPYPVPTYQRLRPRQTARWEIAVLQAPGRARTLYAALGDGRTRSLADVPAGTGACVFEASRRFDGVGPQQAVVFFLGGSGESAGAGAIGTPSQSGEAFVDVVDGRP